MAATYHDIERWFNDGVAEGATHMIIVCDTYDYEDYPVYVMPGQSVRDKYNEYQTGQHSMQRVMEVYSMKADMGKQMNQDRCFNFD